VSQIRKASGNVLRPRIWMEPEHCLVASPLMRG